MPAGIYKRIVGVNCGKGISTGMLGKIAWNKGLSTSEEIKKKISIALKGKPAWNKGIPNSGGFKKGFIPYNKGGTSWNKGIKMSDDFKLKVRNRQLGRKQSKELIEKRVSQYRGKNHWNWKGGISPINETIRHSLESKLWQDSVKNRDGNICQKCGEDRVRYLTAHHILNFSKYIELRFAIDNGITFCRPCHKEFHHIYGVKNNTREQLEEFLIK